MYWPYHLPRNLHREDFPVLDPRGKAKKGPSEDHVAAEGRERNAADGKDLGNIWVMVKDRQTWRDHVAALYGTWRNGHE